METRQDLYTLFKDTDFSEDTLRKGIKDCPRGHERLRLIHRCHVLARALFCVIPEERICYHDEEYIKIHTDDIDQLIERVLAAQEEGKKEKAFLEKRAPDVCWEEHFDKYPNETCDRCELIYPVPLLFSKEDGLFCSKCCKKRSSTKKDEKEEEEEEEEKEEEDYNLCAICMDNPRNAAFSTCGHTNTCLDCAKSVDKCPICRTPKDQIYRVFL